jgi:hypothetical protein
MVCYKDMTFCSAECDFSDDCNEYQPISIASYNRSYF